MTHGTGDDCQHSKICYKHAVIEKAEILRRVMSQTGMSQSELARMSGVRQPSISQMLSGRVEPSDDMLGRLLSCMGFGLEVIRRPIPIHPPRAVRRSWLLHRRLAAHLDDRKLELWKPRILANLDQMSEQIRGEPHRTNLERWRVLVDEGRLGDLHRVITGLDTDSVEMREVSPMRGLLSQAERAQVLQQAV